MKKKVKIQKEIRHKTNNSLPRTKKNKKKRKRKKRRRKRKKIKITTQKKAKKTRGKMMSHFSQNP